MTTRQGEDTAEYVFRVRFRLEPASTAVRVDPSSFETTLYRRADPPGSDGWLFFRDNLWRGELATPEHFRELAEESLGVPVESVTFSELRTDQVYRERLQAAVGDHLEEFNATSAERALTDYLGSSIRVVDGP